jgi:ubiquinone/menaquinone biosynthesis C-methylase UbiE
MGVWHSSVEEMVIPMADDNSQTAKSSNERIFDEHAGRYSETIDQTLGRFGTSHDFFTKHKMKLIERLLASRGRVQAEIDFLDVGCGIANIHALIGSRFRSVMGVDVSTASIRAAAQRFPENSYKSYDGETLPLPDHSVDMTMAICVFHHVPPKLWQRLASEMLRVLRPGGLALVVEHNPYNPVTRRIVNSCPIDRGAVLLPKSATVDLFRRAGAATVEARSILSVPPRTAALMWLDDILGVLPFGAQYWCLASLPHEQKASG